MEAADAPSADCWPKIWASITTIAKFCCLLPKKAGLHPKSLNVATKKSLSAHLGQYHTLVGGSESFYNNELSNENLFRIQSEAIQKAADEHSCIFIGRCADYVLRNHPRCVNVFIAANIADRVRRIQEQMQCDELRALELAEKGDRQRADYYNFYSSGTWGAADTYHLCINSSVLGIEQTADFVKQFVIKKLGLEQG